MDLSLELSMSKTPPFFMLSSPHQYQLKAITFLLGQWIRPSLDIALKLGWLDRLIHHCFQGSFFFMGFMRECRSARDSFWTPWMSIPSSWRVEQPAGPWSFFLASSDMEESYELQRKQEPSSDEPGSDTMWFLKRSLLWLYVCVYKLQWRKIRACFRWFENRDWWECLSVYETKENEIKRLRD